MNIVDKKVENSSCIVSRNIPVYKVKVSKFSGDVRDYRKFKEQFQRYVHPLFCPSYLPFVLQSHLTNEIVEELDSINNNIDQIWDQLDNIYSTQKLIDAILLDISQIQEGGKINILKLIRTIENAYSDLMSVNRQGELENEFVISFIERKLPSVIRSEWIKIATQQEECNSKLKFSRLLKLLQSWRVRLKLDAALTGKVLLDNLQDYNKCRIHRNEDHPIWVCREFRRKGHWKD